MCAVSYVIVIGSIDALARHMWHIHSPLSGQTKPPILLAMHIHACFIPLTRHVIVG